jgi:hypothetical protein
MAEPKLMIDEGPLTLPELRERAEQGLAEFLAFYIREAAGYDPDHSGPKRCR